MITLWLASGVLARQGAAPPIRLIADDGGEVIKRRFYDRQLEQFEEELAAVAVAPKKARRKAVEAAQEAFEPLALPTPDPVINPSLRAISEALARMSASAKRRAEEIEAVEAELARIAAYRRKRRNNDTAILLLM